MGNLEHLQQLTEEAARMEADLARLTRERDEARGEARKWDDAHDEACKALRQAEAREKSAQFQAQVLAESRHEIMAERDRLREALGDLMGLAEQAMREANRDGAEYDIAESLAEARAALRGEEGSP